MAKRVSPTLIGLFVVSASALALGTVILVGSGQFFFKDTSQFVLLFPGSVDGLEVGAPVKFKGVTIGAVSDIRLALEDYPIEEARLPVFIEIDNRKLQRKGGGTGITDAATVRELVNHLGLRAQLRPRSLLTGLLYVQLDLHPGKEPDYSLPPGAPYDEIPAIPAPFDVAQGALERILNKLEATDIDKLTERTIDAVDNVNRLVSDPALRATIESLPQTMSSIDHAAASLRQLATNLDGRAGPLLESSREAARSANVALEQATATLLTIQVLTKPESPLAKQLSDALTEFSQAAYAVRQLAEYLERNPSSVVRGRAGEEGN